MYYRPRIVTYSHLADNKILLERLNMSNSSEAQLSMITSYYCSTCYQISTLLQGSNVHEHKSYMTLFYSNPASEAA